MPVVTPGLLAHLAYCKENGISKEEAVEHFAEAFDRFCSVTVVNPGLLAHLAYCNKNGISQEKALRHFAGAHDRFNNQFAEDETWFNRMEMLDPVEFETQAKAILREILAGSLTKCHH